MATKEDEYLRKISVDFVVEQLRLRGEDAKTARRLDIHDVLIKDKDIKIRVKFSKPRQRSRSISPRWEFSKIIHRSRLWPLDAIDFYILVGFGYQGRIEKFWKISVNDDIIYRKNQIFISANGHNEYQRYELNILENSNSTFRWID